MRSEDYLRALHAFLPQQRLHVDSQRLVLDRDAFDERFGDEAVDPREQLNKARRRLEHLEKEGPQVEAPPATSPPAPALAACGAHEAARKIAALLSAGWP